MPNQETFHNCRVRGSHNCWSNCWISPILPLLNFMSPFFLFCIICINWDGEKRKPHPFFQYIGIPNKLDCSEYHAPHLDPGLQYGCSTWQEFWLISFGNTPSVLNVGEGKWWDVWSANKRTPKKQ